MHEHSYCHLDTTPKYARKTVWKERKVVGTRPVLIDRVKTMQKTVIDYKLQEVPSIKHGTKVIERTKTRTVPGMRKITSTEEFTVKVKKPVTQMRDEEYRDFETQYRPAVRRVKRIRMIPKVINQSVVEFDTESEVVPTSEWVTKQTMATVKVPPIGGNFDPLNGGDDKGNCGCFKQQCAC